MRQATTEGRALDALARCSSGANAIQLGHAPQAASQGQPSVMIALAGRGRNLGVGIANPVNALNPRIDALGGVLSAVRAYILARAQYDVRQRVLETAREGIHIRVSAFQANSCVIGSVALVLRDILDNPVAWQHTTAEVSQLDDRSVFLDRVL